MFFPFTHFRIQTRYFHLVTVKGREYWVHRYEGSLNKIPNAVVLLSYPKDVFGNSKALRVFLCSDLSLDDSTTLDYYLHRWKIEVMFCSQKRYMGFKGFMVRAAKAFDRLLTILCLAHFFFTCGLGSYLPFEASIRSCRASLCPLWICLFIDENLLYFKIWLKCGNRGRLPHFNHALNGDFVVTIMRGSPCISRTFGGFFRFADQRLKYKSI